MTLQPSHVSDDSPHKTDPVSSQKKTLSPANNQPILLPNSSEHESEDSNSSPEKEAADTPTLTATIQIGEVIILM